MARLVFLLLLLPLLSFSQITRMESIQSLIVVAYYNNTPLGTATGFIIKSNTQNYLVTNWHVVTGRNAWDFNWCNPKMQVQPWTNG
jgi:hypothetical protein